MAAMHDFGIVETLHEPTHPRPLPGGEEAFVRVVPVPLLGGVRGGFMVPMHGNKVVEAIHEPCRAAAILRTCATIEAPSNDKRTRAILPDRRNRKNIFTLFLCLAVGSGLKISPCEPVFYSAPL